MKIICSNKLYIEDVSPELAEYAREHLVFMNPDYVKLEAMGKWTGNTQKNIVLYERYDKNRIVLPLGLLRTVYKQFTRKGDRFVLSFADNGERFFDSRISLYDYQERVVKKALSKKNGVIVMPCGSGKTQTALEIVARLGKKCLWLTHTQDLLNQSMERAKSCYGLSLDEYGTITNGKINVGHSITFATVQTLCNVNLVDLRYEFDVIIVDECHKCVGTPTNVMMFYKVLSNLSARYKIGITATPKRADGLEQCMFSLLGDVIDEVSREEVADTTCEVEVEKRYTDYTPDLSVVTAADGTIVFASLIEDLINNEWRNKEIVEDLNKLDGTCLILTDRLAHIDALYNLMEDKSKCAKIDGRSNSKASKALRKQVIGKLNRGEIQYLFATYKLAKEGLDIPTLRYVVFATPQKDYTTVAQSAGRVGRKADGKSKGVVIDYVDDFGLLYGYSKKRNTTYKKLGYKIVDIY